MSRKRDCWDNTVVESLFHILIVEYIHEKRYRTREETCADVIGYSKMFDSGNRLYSALGYINPNDFEKEIRLNAA